MAELEALEKEAKKKAEEARNEVEKTEYAKKKAVDDLENSQSKLKALGKEVDQSLQDFQVSAATEGATMESLEKELYEKMIEKEENRDKAY